MDVKSESWRRQPMPRSQAGQDSMSHIAWRRSGDESSWDRPPRAARPHSCIEGRLKDEWLQTFNTLQTTDIHQQLPPYLQKNDTPRSVSPSLVARSLSSLESLYSGLESKEKVQIKTGPSTQRAKVCCLAPVRIGWLPLQRYVVRKERPNNADQQDGTTCKVKLKPPITPVLSCSSVKANGSEPADGTAGLGVRGMSGAFSLQADDKRKATLAERDQDTALYRATSVQNTSRERFLWQTPVHRRGSVPQASLLTAPPVGGRTTPKHSSSISSITITSRKVIRSASLPDTSISGQDRDREASPMALNNHIIDPDYTNTLCPAEVIPRRKALVVKITEQRVETSRFLQPGAKNGPVYSFPSSKTIGENYFSCLSTRRSSDLAASNLSSVKNHPLLASLSVTGGDMSKMTQKVESQSQVPSCLATQETQTPVVLRRKATIIKVQEHRDTFSKKDEDHRRKVAYRHSFSGLNVTDMKPQLNNECMFSGSEMQVVSSKTKLYKSTMSLQLTSSSGPRLDDSHTSRGSQPRRPASCYASLFSPVEPNADGSQDAAVHSTISVLPHETNIDPACSAASSSNRCWSTEGGAGSHDKIYPSTESSASDKGQSKRESALPRNQPLTLIKVPESSTHETHDAIVAWNAAAIIANIKLQSEQKKKTQTNGNTSGGRDSTSQSKTAGARADKANIAEQSGTASCPVESETAAHMKLLTKHAEFAPVVTADDLLSRSHTHGDALEHQWSDFIRQSQAQERHLLNTHKHQHYHQLSAQGQRGFGSGSE
ncbi:(E2-independent) E3 ubiquitin-conjugating enzyme FATS isoform X2 [Pangasianodon hypophthalmus]|uniref:(E2-independent) E3 ubiquitin-conjugating enzyme FATS isoform X2 n=1 Tax=Pangasianodon hypophthalmus TaxID=310915 RepID=UPI000EFE4F87|nr:(E2-independent) E3 ubiquitin-conjugating enzyme FATS isoform X2 [Pangasianodon hypophthalmus]